MADRVNFPQLDDYYAEREKERTKELVDIFDAANDIVAGAQAEDRPLNPQEQDTLEALERERERLTDEAERDERERNSGLSGEELDELDRLENTPEDMLTGEELDYRDRLRNQVNNAPQDPVPDPDEEYMNGGPPNVGGAPDGGGGMAGGGGMSGGGGVTGGGATDGGDTGGGDTGGGDTGEGDPEGGEMAGGGEMSGEGVAATRTPDMPAGPLGGGDALQPGRIRYLPRGRIRGLSIGLLIRRRFGGAIDPGDSGPQTTVNRGGGSLSGARPGSGVIIDPVPDSGVRTGIRPPEDLTGPRRDPTVTDPAEDGDDPRPH